MNPDEQLDALLHAARESTADTAAAEYAFETRLLARLREERGGSWFSWACRLSPFFAALAVAAAVWGRAYTGVEVDASSVLYAVPSDGPRALTAWLAGDER